MAKKHWHVVANVPGYLPMSDDDYRADTLEDARAAVIEEAEFQAEDYRGYDDIEPSYADDGLGAYVVTDDEYDLGVSIEAIECANDVCAGGMTR